MKETRHKITTILCEGGLYDGDCEITDQEFYDIFDDIDSLDLINFIVEVENVFNIELPDEVLEPNFIKCLGKFIEIIDQLIA